MEKSSRLLTWQLLLLSFLILFLEVALIRWLSTEIRVFAYIKNLPLLASFFGLGIGSLLANNRRSFFIWGMAPLLIVIALVAFSNPLQLTYLIFPASDYVIWGGGSTSAATFYWELGKFSITIVVVTGLIVAIFTALGQELGRLIRQLPALTAYQWNILGSLLGVIVFGAISNFNVPPVWWVAIIGLLWITLLPKFTAEASKSKLRGWNIGFLWALVICALSVGLAYSGGRKAIWSPYYRIDVSQIPPLVSQVPEPEVAGFYIDVNHDYHQKIVNLNEEFYSRFRTHFLTSQRFVYNLPFQFGVTKNVLVVGAGTGNDVAAALRHGAESVHAVEIDPQILALGRGLHPEQPYRSNRVQAFNDDARHFFHTPIYCAGIIFSILFRVVPQRDCALGWNLVGAMIGGLLENGSMLWGLNLLNLVAMGCYVLVVMLVWRKARVEYRETIVQSVG